MQTVQVVMEEDLLQATDLTAKETGISRSALVRRALREYLDRLHIHRLEQADREGYLRQPENKDDLALWEDAAVWPDD